MDGLFGGIQDKSGMRGEADTPADDLAVAWVKINSSLIANGRSPAVNQRRCKAIKTDGMCWPRETLAPSRNIRCTRIIYKTSVLVICVCMTTISPNARALAALGHDARLSIFRLLVQAGDEGLRVSDIGEYLGLAPSTLAHHLSTLVDAGLVLQDKQGREVFNMVDYPAMRRVVGFLTSECCSGVTVQPAADAA